MPPSSKTTVRQHLRTLRRERVPGRDRARDSEELALAALEVVHAAGLGRDDWVAAYEATPLEPPTGAMVGALVARGIRVMVPVTLPDWDLDWREVGTQEPLGTEAIRRVGVVFVPAQGVDRSGTRIGQGKGCYDRALARAGGRLVAMVHPWELREEELPSEPHDRRVHAVMAAGSGVVDVGPTDVQATSGTDGGRRPAP